MRGLSTLRTRLSDLVVGLLYRNSARMSNLFIEAISMNDALRKILQSWRDKRIVVLGIGVSNRPLIRLLLDAGLNVTACDKTQYAELDEEVLALEKRGAKLHVGAGYLDGLQADVVIRSPGIYPNLPQIVALYQNGAYLTSEMELFFDVCPCKIIAVTGSDGKTTTTTVIGKILEHAGHRVFVGGNIGTPLLDRVGEMAESDFAVVELSSFQLMTIKKSPTVAVVTNVAPNHLDWHASMEEYVQAKKNVFCHAPQPQTIVLNADNAITSGFTADGLPNVRLFSRTKTVDSGAYVRGDEIVFVRNGEKTSVLRTSEIKLPGVHNIENYMAAFCAVWDFVSPEDCCAVARDFIGVEHRIEWVRTLRGIRIYNDSIASSPSRATAGLRSFDQKVILIAGGYDKHIPFDDFGGEICRHVKTLVLCGATADAIEHAVLHAPDYDAEHPEILRTDDFTEAVHLAVNHAADGDVVMLSPACAAFDKFKNFMVRGETFKRIVMELT